MPIGNVFVRDSRGYVEHDHGALRLLVIAIAQTTELLLTRRVPNVEDEVPVSCFESQVMHGHTKRGDVLLLKLACQMALHQSGLADAAVPAQHKGARRRRGKAATAFKR